MDRPVSADTANKIIIHTNGGHRYASTKTFSTDEPFNLLFSTYVYLLAPNSKIITFHTNTTPAFCRHCKETDLDY